MFNDLFCMPKGVFFDLCRWLRINTTASDGRYQSLELKLMVFLWIVAYNEPQRNTAYRFQIGQGSVSRIFHQLINPIRVLHTRFVRQPSPADVSPVVECDPKFMQFNGAVGAIDGTHILAFVPIRRQKRFWSRKNNISQNVLAAVNFEGAFVYVLAGAEGSINDVSLIRIALTMDFKVPRGRFYLADAGFGSRIGIVIPFPRTRYHL
jgi:hypothetical protein